MTLLVSWFVIASVSIAAAQPGVAAPVTVVSVKMAEVNRGQRVVGTVRPLRASTIGSATDGRVLRFMVNRGELVEAGQPLAELRTETLKIELAAAEAEAELYRQQLLELRNGARKEDLDGANANLAGAKAAMANAVNKLERAESLALSRAASDAELEDARADVDLRRNTLAVATSLLARLVAGPRPEKIAQADANLQLQMQKVALIKDRIKKHTIRAPFDGYVAEEFTEIGAWVAKGDPIAKVIQLNQVEIDVPATAENAVRLSRGDTVRVEFPELPERVFVGEIHRVVPMADARTRTYPVLVQMQNELRDDTPLLMAGMLARVTLPAGEKTRMPLVPKDALVLNGPERSVFVVEVSDAAGDLNGAEGIVRKCAVTLGVAYRDAIQVAGQVKAGDLVVAVGNERLVDGARVRIVGQASIDVPEPLDASHASR